MATPDPNAFEALVKWLRTTAQWVAQNLGDPAIAGALRADLGLRPSQDIAADSAAVGAKFQPFATGLDPDVEAFEATVDQLLPLIAELKSFAEDPNVTGWDIAFLIAGIAAADSLRFRNPAFHALGKLLLLISDDPEDIDRFDPTLLTRLLSGRLPPTAGQDFFRRVSNSLSLVPPILDGALRAFDKPGYVSYFYGWDPLPDSETPVADTLSQRTLTMLIGPGPIRAAVTMLGVTATHGGPGMIVSLGGDYKDKLTSKDGKLQFDLQVGGAGALNLFIPFGGQDVRADGSPDMFMKLDFTAKGKAGKPAFILGEAKESRLEFGKIGAGLDLANDRAALSFKIEDGALVITPGKADSFLKTILGGDIKVGFNVKLKLDSKKGFLVEGGTGLKATIPVEKTILNALTIHHITLGLGPSSKPRMDLAFEASGAFGLKLGPFQTSVDRLGFTLDLGFGENGDSDDTGLVRAKLGFKPPNGLGMLLDAKVIKGGGYLYIDPERGEYAGAFELKIDLPAVKIGIKAIGVLTTKMPDGGDGWALLLLVYGQFPPIQLSWGFTLTGIGGMIGLQHGVSVDALIAGLKSGALDDILFPANPVADAPRIINRFRTIFPVTRRALILGPMVELGWGTPNLITIRMGVIIQIDNVLGSGDAPVSFGRVLILGQMLLQLPPGLPPEVTVLKFLVDFLGYIEVNPFRIGFVSRLRDSFARAGPAKVDFGGMMVVQAVFGDRPSFVLAAGGFHPQFSDIPPGVPSPIDRLSAAFPIAGVKLRIEAYFAVTPASIQAGANVQLKVKAGPVDVEAKVGFDAICYLVPTFRFDVKIYGSASVKYKGHNLAGIAFEFRLEGPGRWRARGFGKFSILLWDIEVPFDESWGEAVAAPARTEDAQALLAAEIRNPGNWTAQLPIGAEPLVNIATITGGPALLAHPLGTLGFTQRLLPFDLELQKLGTAAIAGTNRFTVTEGYVGTPAARQPVQPMQQHFAIGEYRNLNDAEKLANPGFQSLNAGARFGSSDYAVGPAAPDQTLEYETLYLEPEPSFPYPRRLLRERMLVGLDLAGMRQAIKHGAAARSLIRDADRLQPAATSRIKVGDARLATADTTTLAAGTMALTGAAQVAPALARAAVAGNATTMVVEAFELA